ncbi:DUF982 domain-containing protein [Rhizobium herbae]|jgi:hypothetical protein
MTAIPWNKTHRFEFGAQQDSGRSKMHPNEICKPTEIQWHPVIVKLRGGAERKVCGPLQGFEILSRHIVGRNSKINANAARCCRLAMERKMSPELARQAFVAATMDQELRAT